MIRIMLMKGFLSIFSSLERRAVGKRKRKVKREKCFASIIEMRGRNHSPPRQFFGDEFGCGTGVMFDKMEEVSLSAGERKLICAKVCAAINHKISCQISMGR
jgi:hypothetical protein